ncbi:hypothetical protein A4A49_32236 [Nicotiana attenuata]|uniref:Uncharacterized protein n=1 Tax=Nicotiana attenuata TaxID=49451 RepID=A0A1J6JF17_NICAT|nr:hypothetical protein A4A49_32236 [Nicotiana attenuata]
MSLIIQRSKLLAEHKRGRTAPEIAFHIYSNLQKLQRSENSNQNLQTTAARMRQELRARTLRFQKLLSVEQFF